MTAPSLDIIAIGNAIVDVIAQADDAFIASEGLPKGAMQLLFSPEEAEALYAKMGAGIEASDDFLFLASSCPAVVSNEAADSRSLVRKSA